MWSRIGSLLLGRALPTAAAPHERLSILSGLAIFSSDALSSVAYATEELMLTLMLGGMVALLWSVPLSIVIVGLMAVLTISYRQTIRAYPGGGGSYTVAKENLGTRAGLIAASGLLIDYVLTVAVSVSAGIAALTSAFPGLASYQVQFALIFLAVVTVVNLRGLRSTGRAFTFPTVLFVLSMLALLAVGFVRYVAEGAPDRAAAPLPTEALASVSLFLLLRGFSSGCVALTGIEAILNSTPSFKAPEARNAARAMAVMAIILATLFFGTTLLAHLYSIVPVAGETVVSQIGRVVFGTGPLYYVVQISTLAILLFAANTSFSAFPRVAAVMAQDKFLPRQLSDMGHRLVYSNGIILLALFSGALIVGFGAKVHSLIPLYAVGVFLCFTLSQAGMLKRWLDTREKGWLYGTVINGLGATATFVALAVIVLTKFTHGAWLVLLLVPLFLYVFYRIHKHYEMVAEELTLEGFQAPEVPRRQMVIVPVSGVHRGVLHALAYARCISNDVRAVYVATDQKEMEALRHKWQQYVPDVPLEVLYSPYRRTISVLLKYLDGVEASSDKIVSVVIPEFVPRHLWEIPLHRQTATMLKLALVFRGNIPVISVPHHLRR